MIHTESPLPWKYDNKTEKVTDAFNDTVMNSEVYGCGVVLIGDQKAIVTAVNSHNELLAVAQALAAWDTERNFLGAPHVAIVKQAPSSHR